MRKIRLLVLEDSKIKRPAKRKGQRDKTIKVRNLERTHNFLKYWRVVRYWALRKYGISQEELEILLYLYDENIFTRDVFTEFSGLLTWDKQHLSKMIDKGWVVVWRLPDGRNSRKKLYALSAKAKQICSLVYRKLLQEEHIPENGRYNPIFTGDAYMDKVYRRAIKLMNKRKKQNEKENPDD